MHLGIVGLGIMGENLALNAAEHGFSVAVWDIEQHRVDRFLAANTGRPARGAAHPGELAAALDRPRRILILVPAGSAVDDAIDRLLPHLHDGDVLIDGGNSWFLDTVARSRRAEAKGLHYVGLGISGGEDGARHGASLMAGCSPAAWPVVAPLLEALAARSDSGLCVTRVGPDGSGHFVKMVHNGIEYADLQIIAEVYDLLRKPGGMRSEELVKVFEEWNGGPLQSFLIEITARVLRDPLIDRIIDQAGQKGTGKWTTRAALDLGVPVPTITAAVDARLLSSSPDRRGFCDTFAAPVSSLAPSLPDLHDALLAARLSAWAQGMSLIRAASKERQWDIDLAEVARIWKAGCIIAGRVVETVRRAYAQAPALANLLFDEEMASVVRSVIPGLRRTVVLAHSSGVPVPAMSASLAWFEALRSERLPQNLTQAQRHLFGGHAYVVRDEG